MNIRVKESTPARDVQELERQLSQIKRLYATLSQVNQLLVRVKEREELYRSMCEVVVRYGGFTLAWVGILDDETGDVRPFAAKGMDLDHWPFENINIRHGVLSDSLSAMAIRTGGVVTSEDIQTDGRMQKIHDRLNHFPFHSSASIPFRLRGKIIGMLNLVSDEEGLFKSEEELHLLQEMGADISFALDAMESETERLRVEAHLEQSRRTLALFVEYAPAAIAMFDCNMRYIAASRRFLNDYHLGSMDVIGKSHYEIFPDVPERWKEIHRRCLAGASEKAEKDPFPREDGGMEWIRWEIHPWYQKEGKIGGILLFSEVITDMEKMHAQLLQSQKLESLGTLASGIAHDFNNILSIIIGNASLLEQEHVDMALLPKRVRAILKAGMRGADLVRQLLTFARAGEVEIRSININECADEIVKLIHETFPKSIAVHTDLSASLPAIAGDGTHIHQVLLNLCVNARDAMPKGGTITIRTSVESGTAVRLTHPSAVAQKYVVLSVADTGIGMDEATQQRIFEPFFTTKERGKGTGLGLSTVFGIMESHNGFVELHSEAGQGTEFSCSFPVPDDDR